MQHIRIELTADHLQRFYASNPIDAVSELIWNSLDADADRVSVVLDYDVLGAVQAVRVIDNGSGIPFSEIGDRFRKLGDSWKRLSRTSKEKNRFLHGKDGQGRFKALSLGRIVHWDIIYVESGKNYQYNVRLISDDPTDLIVSDQPTETTRDAGVTVKITELHRQLPALEHPDAVEKIGERFALYLNQYRDVQIKAFDSVIDPETYIKSIETFTLSGVKDDDEIFPVEYDIVQWKVRSERRIYFCDFQGFPLAERNPRFHVPGFDFVGYLKSDYFQKLVERNLIDVDGLNENIASMLEEARKATKSYYRKLATEGSQSIIDRWKSEKVYPYASEPESESENAERQVFDIVALTVKDHIEAFDELPTSMRRFNFELLKQALENNPNELRFILEEVIKLPERKLQELAGLLEDVELANIIEASATVSERMTFIQGLEELVYNEDHSNDLLERAQLHQVIAQNIWLFGEQYALTVSDKGLTQVLKKHSKNYPGTKVIDRPVKRADGSVGIVDLMLSRAAKPVRSGQIEHLIIELKRPTVPVGISELTQAFSYADAVARDERFAVGNAEWEFWVISTSMTDDARALANQAGKPPGLYYESGTINPKVRVWAKTWSEVIQDAKVRMQFYRDKLNLEMDGEKAVKRLKKTYAKYFEQPDDDDPEQQDDEIDGDD